MKRLICESRLTVFLVLVIIGAEILQQLQKTTYDYQSEFKMQR